MNSRIKKKGLTNVIRSLRLAILVITVCKINRDLTMADLRLPLRLYEIRRYLPAFINEVNVNACWPCNCGQQNNCTVLVLSKLKK